MCSLWKQQNFVALVLITHILQTFSYEHEALKSKMKLNEARKIETIFSWEKLQFDLKENRKQAAIDYVEANNLLGNVRLFKNKFYVSVPRYLDGVPATLNTIEYPKGKTDEVSPILHPFPNMEENEIGNCTCLQNVLAIEIDPFGRLWVVDSGNAEIYRSGKSQCNAKILVYQLCKT